MYAKIDAAGRLVAPKAIREAAGLLPGTRVQFRVLDGRVEIEPVASGVTFRRVGPSVAAVAPPGTPPLTTNEVERILEETRFTRATTHLPE